MKLKTNITYTKGLGKNNKIKTLKYKKQRGSTCNFFGRREKIKGQEKEKVTSDKPPHHC